MFGWALPWRSGSRPVTSAFWATLTSPASPLSSSGTSIRAPSPPCSPARMAAAACRPASTSTSATPTLYGGPLSPPLIQNRAGSPRWLAQRAEAGDRAVDHARIALPHLLVPHAQPVGAAPLEVLDHGGGAGAELQGEGSP